MTTPKNTTGGPDREYRRCNQKSRDARNKDPLSVPYLGAAYRVSLAIDTPVPTATGWTSLGNIVLGERVFDEEGQICTVMDVSEETEEITNRLMFRDGSNIVAGNHHPWMTLTPADFSTANSGIYRPGTWNAGGWPMATIELAFSLNWLKERRRTGSSNYIPVAGGLILGDRELPIDPWILGLWLGDCDSKSATIYTGPEDEPHYRERIRETGELWRVLNPGGRSSGAASPGDPCPDGSPGCATLTCSTISMRRNSIYGRAWNSDLRCSRA